MLSEVPGIPCPVSRELFELGAEPAVDVEYRAGHEGGSGAGEEDDTGGNFLRGAVALPRVLRALGFREIAPVLWALVGIDRAGLQHVDGDAARSEVARRALGVTDVCSLGS